MTHAMAWTSSVQGRTQGTKKCNRPSFYMIDATRDSTHVLVIEIAKLMSSDLILLHL